MSLYEVSMCLGVGVKKQFISVILCSIDDVVFAAHVSEYVECVFVTNICLFKSGISLVIVLFSKVFIHYFVSSDTKTNKLKSEIK